MDAESKRWLKIEADFLAGVPLGDICRKYKISYAVLLAKAKEGGWKHGAAKERPKAEASVTTLPVPVVVQPDPVAQAVEEALADIIRDHKRMARNVRARLDHELAEHQAMQRVTASFLDEARINELKAKAANGQPGELFEYLTNAMRVRKLSAELCEKVVKCFAVLIQAERRILGLDNDDGQPEAATWDDLLEQSRRPLAPRELPANVVEFERKIGARPPPA